MIAKTEKRVGEIILESKAIKNISDEEKIEILIDAVRKNGLELLDWKEEVTDWLARIECAKNGMNQETGRL